MYTHNETHNIETVAIKACCACGTGLLESYKFCRNCGLRQSAQFATAYSVSAGVEEVRSASGAFSATEHSSDAYHPVSGPLVKAVVASVSSGNTAPIQGRLLNNSILALISIPIWIMILLLSPIDAYIAARSFRRVIQ